MCCYYNKSITKKVRDGFNKKEFVNFYKAIKDDGFSAYVGHRYGPGEHKCRVSSRTYDFDNPRGIHVFVSRKHANQFANTFGYETVRVRCKKQDFAFAGFGITNDLEAVFRKIEITPQAWRAAGFKTKRLYSIRL